MELTSTPTLPLELLSEIRSFALESLLANTEDVGAFAKALASFSLVDREWNAAVSNCALYLVYGWLAPKGIKIRAVDLYRWSFVLLKEQGGVRATEEGALVPLRLPWDTLGGVPMGGYSEERVLQERAKRHPELTLFQVLFYAPTKGKHLKPGYFRVYWKVEDLPPLTSVRCRNPSDPTEEWYVSVDGKAAF